MASNQEVKARANMAEMHRVRNQAERADMNIMLPGRIVEFDPVKQQAKVEVMAMQYHAVNDSDDNEFEAKEYPILEEVPIVQTRGGSFAFTKPVKAGDGVMLNFAQKSFEEFYKNNKNEEPASRRMNDLSDAVATLGFEPEEKKLENYDNTNMQFRAGDGTSAITFSPDGKFAIEGNGEELLTIVSELLDLLSGEVAVVGTGSSAGDWAISHQGDFGALKSRLDAIKLRQIWLITELLE